MQKQKECGETVQPQVGFVGTGTCDIIFEGVHTLLILGKLSRNLARLYSGLNLSFMICTIYLSDLVYWIGFVTGITFTTHL